VLTLRISSGEMSYIDHEANKDGVKKKIDTEKVMSGRK
jgi:hypothetical protein